MPYILSVNEKGNRVNSKIWKAKKCIPAPIVNISESKTSACLQRNWRLISNQTKAQLDVNNTNVLYKGKPKGLGACIPTGGHTDPIQTDGLTAV